MYIVIIILFCFLLPLPHTQISEDDFSTIEIPSRLKVYPASTLGRGDMNSGDKIILSPHVLLACEQQELSYPIVSRLTALYPLDDPLPNTVHFYQFSQFMLNSLPGQIFAEQYTIHKAVI